MKKKILASLVSLLALLCFRPAHARYRRIAAMIDKIFNGTKPSDIPVEQPMKFEFVVNLKAAKQIGLTVPPEMLARATRINR